MKPKSFISLSSRHKEKLLFAFKLGQHLKKHRLLKDITQEQLSMDAGYYHTYVNKIENGKYSPSMHTIWRLVHAMGLTLSDFFKGFFVLFSSIVASLPQRT